MACNTATVDVAGVFGGCSDHGDRCFSIIRSTATEA